MDALALPTVVGGNYVLHANKFIEMEVQLSYHENLQNKYKLFKYVTTSPSPKSELIYTRI
jgi:hypothetical protein